MPEPETADASGGDREDLLAQFVRDAGLPPRRLCKGQLDDRPLHFRRHSILEEGLLPRNLLEGASPPVSYSSLKR